MEVVSIHDMGSNRRRSKKGGKGDVPERVSTSELAHPMRYTTLTFNNNATLQLRKRVNGPTLSRTRSNGSLPSKRITRRKLSVAHTGA